MAPASPRPTPTRKRSQVRDENDPPSPAPVETKRRRSSAEDAKAPLAGAPEGQLFVVTVRTQDELQPCEDVAVEEQVLDQLLRETKREDDAWGREFAALDALRRFASHHLQQAKRQLDQGALQKLVLPAANSLRSAVARNALLCVQELLLGLREETAAYLDEIVPVLLSRACSEKQFLRDLARQVLDTALDANVYDAMLRPLLGTSTTDKNAQIVSVAGLYVTKCIVRMDHEELRTFVRARGSFVDEMAAFLNCKVVECKAATRRCCQHTRRVIGNDEFVAMVKEKLSGSAQLDALKASEIRKAAKPGNAKSSIRERMLQMKRQQQQKKVQSGGNDVEVVVVAPPPPRSRSSSAQPPQSL